MHKYNYIWSIYHMQLVLHGCLKCAKSSELMRCINAFISLPWEEFFFSKKDISSTAGFLKLFWHDFRDVLMYMMSCMWLTFYSNQPYSCSFLLQFSFKYRDVDVNVSNIYSYAASVVIFQGFKPSSLQNMIIRELASCKS